MGKYSADELRSSVAELHGVSSKYRGRAISDSNLKDKEDRLKRMKKEANVLKALILPLSDLDWMGYRYSGKFIEANDDMVTCDNCLVSIVLAIITWLFAFPVSPINLPDFVDGYRIYWMFISAIFVALAGFAFYFIISSIKQAIISVKTLNTFITTEISEIELTKKQVTEYYTICGIIEKVVKLIDKYTSNETDNTEILRLLSNAVDICLGLDDLKDKSGKVAELEQIVSKIEALELSDDTLEKYQLDSEKRDLLTKLDRGARKSIGLCGIYKNQISQLIDKCEDLVKIGFKPGDDTIANIVNIVIPELIKLCSESSKSQNTSIVEALSLTEQKLDVLLSSSEKMFDIKAKSTTSAIKKLLS